MPIRIRMSEQLGLVVVTLEGVVTEDEVRRQLTPLIEVPEVSLLPHLLLDATRAEGASGLTEVVHEGALKAIERIDSRIDPGAKAAIAATRDEFFAYGRMYEQLRGDSPVAFHVFRSLREAEEWLELPEGYEERLRDAQP